MLNLNGAIKQDILSSIVGFLLDLSRFCIALRPRNQALGKVFVFLPLGLQVLLANQI